MLRGCDCGCSWSKPSSTPPICISSSRPPTSLTPRSSPVHAMDNYRLSLNMNTPDLDDYVLPHLTPSTVSTTTITSTISITSTTSTTASRFSSSPGRLAASSMAMPTLSPLPEALQLNPLRTAAAPMEVTPHSGYMNMDFGQPPATTAAATAAASAAASNPALNPERSKPVPNDDPNRRTAHPSAAPLGRTGTAPVKPEESSATPTVRRALSKGNGSSEQESKYQ